MKLTLDQLRVFFVPRKMKHFAITKNDIGKIFTALHVSPSQVVYRIVSLQELLELEKFVLEWYELNESDVNFVPENIKPL